MTWPISSVVLGIATQTQTLNRFFYSMGCKGSRSSTLLEIRMRTVEQFLPLTMTRISPLLVEHPLRRAVRRGLGLRNRYGMTTTALMEAVGGSAERIRFRAGNRASA